MRTFAGAEIRQHDFRAMTDDELAAVARFNNTMRAEARPDDPPRPVELTIAAARSMPSFIREWFWAAWSGAEVVAAASCGFREGQENRHALWAEVEVAPDWRRQGLARRFLTEIVAVAEAEERSLVLGGTDERVPSGRALCEAVGAEPGLVQRESELVLADVDWEAVQRWADDGPVRAPGYEVFRTGDEYPEELLAEIAELYQVTNTAPRDDLALEDETTTPEMLREWEKQGRATGSHKRTWWARHVGSGRLAGWTEVYWQPKLPQKVGQGWTAVHPDHRGHALGKWVKSVALLAIREEWPEAEKVVTDNAYSNDAMLGINNQLGFVETRAHVAWQVPTERVRSWVGSAAPSGLAPA